MHGSQNGCDRSEGEAHQLLDVSIETLQFIERQALAISQAVMLPKPSHLEHDYEFAVAAVNGVENPSSQSQDEA